LMNTISLMTFWYSISGAIALPSFFHIFYSYDIPIS
jgi:hypothetical protein